MESLEKVCSFLKERRVDDIVIETFRQNQMDEASIAQASSHQLEQLGLKEMGHILCLKAFVMKNSFEEPSQERKKVLVNSIKTASQERITGQQKTTRKVQIGWKLNSGSSWSQIRAASGGGVRELNVQNDEILDDIMNRGIELFFPNGTSKKFGSSKDYIVQLGDFSAEAISDLTKSISQYLSEVKMLGRVRLYILTRKKSMSTILDEVANLDSDDDFDTRPLLKKSKKIEKMIDLSSDDGDCEYIPEFSESALVKKEASNEINAAFNEDSDQKLQALTERMAQHKDQVLEEPSLMDPHVTVTVRHPTLGLKIRIFKEEATFKEVYGWVASMATEPEWFHLVEYFKNTLAPSKKVFSSCLNMLVFTDKNDCDPEVVFALEGNMNNLTDKQNELTFVISSEDEDPDKDSDAIHARKKYPLRNMQGSYSDLLELKKRACQNLIGERHVTVNRENIYNDMLTIFKRRINSYLSVSFVREEAVGDGVTKDAFSAFFDCLYDKFDGSFSRIPTIASDEEEMEIIGNVIYQAFIQCEIYPFRISKSAMTHYLDNTIDDETLIEDFFQFIPTREAILVKEFMRGDKSDVQPIIDILMDYRVYEKPTVKNIRALLLKAVKTCLIRIPAVPFQHLVKSLSIFKGKTASIYEQMVPTATKVIDCLSVEEKTQHEQQITTWLHRLIRTMELQELAKFLRFICGSPSFDPNMVIKVDYQDQSLENLRPRSLTCFKVLQLPRQYNSFYQLRDNICMYLKNDDTWTLHDDV